MTELLALPYSPWSEKARWALDVRHVPYTFRLYAPVIGEPALRWRLRRAVGRVTVPVLTLDDGSLIADSTAIARWADTRGNGPTLFPADEAHRIAHWLDLSERGLQAGRALSLHRLLHDDEALTEVLPRRARKALGPFATKVGAAAIRRTFRKYGGDRKALDEHQRVLEGVLDEMRAATKQSTLLGRFTFADIAAAQVLVSLAPPPSGLKLGAATQRCFCDPKLRERYSDLVAWRDALYRAFRK